MKVRQTAQGIEIVDETCGCFACTDEVQPGHFLCSAISGKMKRLEAYNQVERAYVSNRWTWFIRDESGPFLLGDLVAVYPSFLLDGEEPGRIGTVVNTAFQNRDDDPGVIVRFDKPYYDNPDPYQAWFVPEALRRVVWFHFRLHIVNGEADIHVDRVVSPQDDALVPPRKLADDLYDLPGPNSCLWEGYVLAESPSAARARAAAEY